MFRRRLAVAVVLPLLLIPSAAFAQWIPDGNPVSTAANVQWYSRVIGDTQGGVFVAWQSSLQGGVNYDIYIEHYDGFGQRLWSTAGVTVSAAINNQIRPAMVADDSGGVYVAWADNRGGDYDVYAQHFDQDGNELWTPGGLLVCNRSDNQENIGTNGPHIVRSDVKNGEIDRRTTGVIVAWQDNRTGNSDIYAQRIDDATGIYWAADGVEICGAADYQIRPQMVSDGSEGAILVWADERVNSSFETDIYAQRVNSAGTVQWTADGVGVCTAAYDQDYPQALSDGAGGVYISWTDRRLGLFSPLALYMQRVDGSGASLWTANGTQIYGYVEADEAPLALEPDGGVVVSWRDTRNGNVDIFAQRLTANATRRWGPIGTAVCARAGDDGAHRMSSDGEGGLWVAWENSTPNVEAYIQHLDSTATQTFGTTGRLVTNAADAQFQPDVCIDGPGPAFCSWTDRRNSVYSDVYLTRIYHTVTGVEPPSADAAVLIVRAVPNPAAGEADLVVTAPAAGPAVLDVYDVAGRRVAHRDVTLAAGANRIHFAGRDDAGRALPSGVYFARVRAGGLMHTTKLVLAR